MTVQSTTLADVNKGDRVFSPQQYLETVLSVSRTATETTMTLTAPFGGQVEVTDVNETPVYRVTEEV